MSVVPTNRSGSPDSVIAVGYETDDDSPEGPIPGPNYAGRPTTPSHYSG